MNFFWLNLFKKWRLKEHSIGLSVYTLLDAISLHYLLQTFRNLNISKILIYIENCMLDVHGFKCLLWLVCRNRLGSPRQWWCIRGLTARQVAEAGCPRVSSRYKSLPVGRVSAWLEPSLNNITSPSPWFLYRCLHIIITWSNTECFL